MRQRGGALLVSAGTLPPFCEPAPHTNVALVVHHDDTPPTGHQKCSADHASNTSCRSKAPGQPVPAQVWFRLAAAADARGSCAPASIAVLCPGARLESAVVVSVTAGLTNAVGVAWSEPSPKTVADGASASIGGGPSVVEPVGAPSRRPWQALVLWQPRSC